MSRSNNTELKNPALRFYEWKGEGGFKYYDKEAPNDKGEKGKNIDVPLPFTFLALDTLSTIKGWSDAHQSGYWSNEIRDIKKDILTVRTKNGVEAIGVYEHVKILTGAKYTQSVYCAVKNDTGMEIANIQIHGAALGAWIEFRKKNKIFEGAITVKQMIQGKKGATVYQIPVFKMVPVSPETEEKAKALDVELQDYLSKYLAAAVRHTTEAVTEQVVTTETGTASVDVIRQNHSTPGMTQAEGVDDIEPLPF